MEFDLLACILGVNICFRPKFVVQHLMAVHVNSSSARLSCLCVRSICQALLPSLDLLWEKERCSWDLEEDEAFIQCSGHLGIYGSLHSFASERLSIVFPEGQTHNQQLLTPQRMNHQEWPRGRVTGDGRGFWNMVCVGRGGLVGC